MRIIDTDNFGGDYPNESFIGGFFSQRNAEAIVKAYIDGMHDYSPRIWKVVPDDYKLQPGFEP